MAQRKHFCFSPSGLRFGFPELLKIYLNNTEIYQWCWLAESGQRLKIVDKIHLVLACGKLAQQKIDTAITNRFKKSIQVLRSSKAASHQSTFRV